MSAASTAGWVISVCSNWYSSWLTVAGSSASTKMKSLSGRPSSGVMIRSASANVSATIGSTERSVLSMLRYCEPCPV